MIITFDIELASRPKHISDALKGKVGLGCAVLWDDTRPHIYDIHTGDALVEHLESADTLVSYNGISFDIPVLESILQTDIDIDDHYDILEHIWAALGTREQGYKLNDVATRTLGLSKQRESAGVPELFTRGHHAEVIDHCIHDVWLTKKLYDHIIDEGFIIDRNGERLYME